MSELLGYASINQLYTFTAGLSPMLLLGPSGLGKKRWCIQRAEEFAGKPMTKVLTAPKVSDFQQYNDISSGKFKSAWVIDLTKVFSGKSLNLQVVPYIISFIKKSTNDYTRVFLYSDVEVSQDILDVTLPTHVPLLSNEEITILCQNRGYEPDETEFALNFAQGVPGEITTAFSILKRRTIIFELRELLFEDKVAKMEERIKQLVTKEDMVFLSNILTSFDTGNWTLFKEHEVAFLVRVKELIRNVLSYEYANAEICYVTIFHAAAHAYHGRV